MDKVIEATRELIRPGIVLRRIDNQFAFSDTLVIFVDGDSVKLARPHASVDSSLEQYAHPYISIEEWISPMSLVLRDFHIVTDSPGKPKLRDLAIYRLYNKEKQ